MTDHEAMLAIQELLDGQEWSSDTLDQIAEIMIKVGYRIRDMNDVDRRQTDEHHQEARPHPAL